MTQTMIETAVRPYGDYVAEWNRIDGTTNWIKGDLLAKLVTEYGAKTLATFASDTEAKASTLYTLRQVALAYPENSRRGEIRWSVYRELVSLPDRLRLIAELPAGTTKAEAVALARGQPEPQPDPDPDPELDPKPDDPDPEPDRDPVFLNKIEAPGDNDDEDFTGVLGLLHHLPDRAYFEAETEEYYGSTLNEALGDLYDLGDLEEAQYLLAARVADYQEILALMKRSLPAPVRLVKTWTAQPPGTCLSFHLGQCRPAQPFLDLEFLPGAVKAVRLGSSS